MKYLVELKHSNLPADYILTEMQLEFGAYPEKDDPDILLLKVGDGRVKVLLDEDRDRVWITIDADSDDAYNSTADRIEDLLNRTRHVGNIEWSQIEI